MSGQQAFNFARDGFDLAVPAQRDSHSSQRAAAKLRASGVQGDKMRRLLAALKAAGAHGCTDSEIEIKTGLPRQSICSLRGSARERGLIVAVGEREGAYKGFMQTVWRLK